MSWDMKELHGQLQCDWSPPRERGEEQGLPCWENKHELDQAMVKDMGSHRKALSRRDT